MAMEWRILQEKSERWWKLLHEVTLAVNSSSKLGHGVSVYSCTTLLRWFISANKRISIMRKKNNYLIYQVIILVNKLSEHSEKKCIFLQK